MTLFALIQSLAVLYHNHCYYTKMNVTREYTEDRKGYFLLYLICSFAYNQGNTITNSLEILAHGNSIFIFNTHWRFAIM